VWRVDSNGQPILLTNLDTFHLEGVITLTNDVAKWGPWAGKIVTGDEHEHAIYAIDADGIFTRYETASLIPGGIDPEDFDIIPANLDLYNLYACDPDAGQIVKLSGTLLTNYVGDLLITQGGEFFPNLIAKVFIVHWDGSNFVTRSIPYFRQNQTAGHFEHITFAPINIPPITP
jgi:hypothetical protein